MFNCQVLTMMFRTSNIILFSFLLFFLSRLIDKTYLIHPPNIACIVFNYSAIKEKMTAKVDGLVVLSQQIKLFEYCLVESARFLEWFSSIESIEGQGCKETYI